MAASYGSMLTILLKHAHHTYRSDPLQQGMLHHFHVLIKKVEARCTMCQVAAQPAVAVGMEG